MYRVGVDFLQDGMQVARSIYRSDGRVLLAAGTRLNKRYIKRLHELGIRSVYVRNDELGPLDPVPDIVSEQTRLESLQAVREGFNSLENKRRINMAAIRQTVDNLIDELLANSEVLINCSDIRSYDDYTFHHSVNVCILALMTGITLGYHQLRLKELGVGALLHDVGKIRIDQEIICKPGPLTPEEFEQVKEHARQGFEILRTYEEVGLLSAHVAFQHHERWDGRGYPRGLGGRKIHEYARIVAVADVFDALSADRPYRRACPVHEVVNLIRSMSGTSFDPQYVEALLANVAIFPVGSLVVLSTGDIGLVVDVDRNAPTRPVVRHLADRNMNPVPKRHEIRLQNLSTVYISRALSETETAKVLKRIALKKGPPALEVSQTSSDM